VHVNLLYMYCYDILQMFCRRYFRKKFAANSDEAPPALSLNPFLEHNGTSLIRCKHQRKEGEHWWYCGKCYSKENAITRRSHNIGLLKIIYNICILWTKRSY
jgi:hypothetical protein